MSDILDDVVGTVLGAVDAAADLLYDEAIIAEITSALGACAVDLEAGSDLPVTGPSSYGASPAGSALARNADLAREKVVEAITDMATGLEGFRAVVGDFHAHAQEVEGSTTASLATLQKSVDCAGQPTIAAPSQCVAPGGDD